MIDTCLQVTNCAIINTDEKMLILIITAICLGRQFGFELRQRPHLRSTLSQINQFKELEELLMDFFEEIVLTFVTNLVFGIIK